MWNVLGEEPLLKSQQLHLALGSKHHGIRAVGNATRTALASSVDQLGARHPKGKAFQHDTVMCQRTYRQQRGLRRTRSVKLGKSS